MRLLTLTSLMILFAQPLFASEPPTYDRVHLSATATQAVENDLLVAEVFAQAEGQDTAALAAEINARVTWALDEAAAVPAVSVQTLEYQAQPVYRNNRVDGWRVSQALRLESANRDEISALIGRLQARLLVRSISYEVSAPHRKAAIDGLVERAIADFRDRAGRVAQAFGKTDYRVVAVDVITAGRGPEPRRYAVRAMAMAEAAAAPPVFESGTQDLEVEVSGTVELY